MCVKNNLLDQLVQLFRNSGRLKVVLVALGISNLFNFSFGFIRYFFGHLNVYFFTTPLQQGNSLESMLLSDVIIAPIVETFIFQWLIFILLKRWKVFRNNVRLIIILSALFFGATHCYDIFYMVFVFFIGLIYMAVFVSKSDKIKQAFWIVVLIHAFDNLITLSFFWMLG